MIWIGYTTRYRGGGAEMARVAHTLARERGALHPHLLVRCEAVESKAAFVAAMRHAPPLHELHLIAHSGMYGPMFGSTAWPEQLSPHEWRSLSIPFAEGGAAWFHSCRSARWFAPFFARTFGVPAHGYHWYTTFSARPDRFVWAGPWVRGGSGPEAPLYVLGAPGRKSHGLLGSALKYGLGRAEQMQRFEPPSSAGAEAGAGVELGASYDGVAELYDRVFEDIRRVRRDEWRWLEARVPSGSRLLDLGCGNGALLSALAPRLSLGVGVDASAGQLTHARRRCADQAHLSFSQVREPVLPYPDGHFDLAVSLLSWRYLDWDPMLRELSRVLTPAGRLLVVDMAASPPSHREWPRLAADKARTLWAHRRDAGTRAALAALVGDARWQEMLRHNPIRAEHEYRWYLESRFPGRRVEILNIGWSARVLAFDSGPFSDAALREMSYP